LFIVLRNYIEIAWVEPGSQSDHVRSLSFLQSPNPFVCVAFKACAGGECQKVDAE